MIGEWTSRLTGPWVFHYATTTAIWWHSGEGSDYIDVCIEELGGDGQDSIWLEGIGHHGACDWLVNASYPPADFETNKARAQELCAAFLLSPTFAKNQQQRLANS